MKCNNCGKEVNENWKLCPWCKISLEKVPKCPNCGEEVDASWDVCPICKYPLDVFNKSNGTDQRHDDQPDADYQKKLNFAHIACLRGKYEQARTVYEELLIENPKDINIHTGLVRVESQNYTQYQGSDIEKAISLVELMCGTGEQKELDKQYLVYLEKRNSELARLAAEEKNRIKAEKKRKAKEEAERKKAERKEAKRKKTEHKEAKRKNSKRKIEEEMQSKADESGFVIQDGVLVKYNGIGGTITIPSRVRCIGSCAFKNCTTIKSVIIPDSVVSIGESAFEGCLSLASVTISNSVTTIGRSVFRDCSALTKVIIPKSVISIEYSAFYHCTRLKKIVFINGLVRIGECAFYGCTSLRHVTIPKSVTSIEYKAFVESHIRRVYLHRYCEYSQYAFNQYCRIKHRR